MFFVHESIKWAILRIKLLVDFTFDSYSTNALMWPCVEHTEFFTTSNLYGAVFLSRLSFDYFNQPFS